MFKKTLICFVVLFAVGAMAETSGWETPTKDAPFSTEDEIVENIEGEFAEANQTELKQPELDQSELAQPAVIPSAAASKPSSVSANGRSSKKFEINGMAAKGLVKIDKDGSYIYRTEVGKKNQSVAVRISSGQTPAIASADGRSSFANMYGSSNVNGLLVDYEWQPVTAYGKLGVQLGGGITLSKGNGRFLNDGTEAKEEYSFVTFPMSLGGIYRLEYFEKQWIAPYVGGGLSYIGMLEYRDDDSSPKLVGTTGAYGSAGLMLSLTAFDRQVAYDLFSEYNVAALWVVLEFRRQQSLSADLDVSSNIINAGIAVDY